MNRMFIMYQFEIGGVESVFRELGKCCNTPIKLVTVTPRYNKSLIDSLSSNVEYIAHNNIPILRNLFWLFNSKAKILYILLAIIILPIFLRFRVRNVAVINFSDTVSSLLVSILSARKKYRFSWVHCRPKALLNSRTPGLYIRLLSCCRCVICICNDQKNELLALFPALLNTNIEVIYNPVDIDAICRMAQESLPAITRTSYICMVSRLDERSKDFKTAIEAYALLPPLLRESYVLQIIGDGPDEDKVREYITKNNLDGYVILQGRDANPYKWMANASLFLFSSKSEGLGLVILEALACGQMVVATDCPIGPKEILKSGVDCGLLVPVGDANCMRDAIIKVLDPTFIKVQYQENARLRLQEFSHDMFKMKIEYLFKQYD